MRLTLRTLLAYMDDAVDPADAQALSQKIEESDFASGLIQRVRSVVRKPRLPAPKVDGKGLGQDPNSVAEYIESTLPPERVNEFERLCLESDMHLAEVSATHHVLTLVLGQPANFPPELRQRVYRLDNAENRKAVAPVAEEAKTNGRSRAATAAVPEPTPPAPVASAVAAPVKSRDDSSPPREVPEYLRSGRAQNKWLPIAATIAAGFLLAFVVLRAMGPFDGTHPLAAVLFGGSGPVAQSNTLPPLEPAPKPQPSPAPPAPPSNVIGPPEQQAIIPPPPVPNPPVPVVPPDEPMPPPSPMEPAPMEPVPAEPPKNTVPSDAPPPPEPMPPSIPTEPVKPVEPAPAVPARPMAVGDMGRLVGEGQLLARFDTKADAWVRVPTRALLTAKERLISLPLSRPLIAVPSGVQVILIGENHFQMEVGEETGAPRMSTHFGRLEVVTDGVAGGKLELNLAGLSGELTLQDAESLAAVDVRHYLPPGADPLVDKPLRVVEIFAVNGRATFTTKTAKTEIAPQHVLTILDEETPELNGPYKAPEWVDVKSIRDIDREAAALIEKTLDTERPLILGLQEKMDDRRVEVRSVCARLLAALNHFDPLVSEINDPRQTLYWNAACDSLRASILRSSFAAEEVQKAFGRVYGEKGNALYRMLSGYSQEQLTSGAGEQLVAELESADIVHRVLGCNTLEKITGGTFAYRPSSKPETNRPSIMRFRNLVKDGTLTYKVAPDPRSERKPLEGKRS